MRSYGSNPCEANGNHHKSALHSRNLMICAREVPRFSFVTIGRDIVDENEAWSGSNILIPFLHHSQISTSHQPSSICVHCANCRYTAMTTTSSCYSFWPASATSSGLAWLVKWRAEGQQQTMQPACYGNKLHCLAQANSLGWGGTSTEELHRRLSLNACLVVLSFAFSFARWHIAKITAGRPEL